MNISTLPCPVMGDLARYMADQDQAARKDAMCHYYRALYLAELDINDMINRTDVALTSSVLLALFNNDIPAARSTFYTLMTVAAADYAETMMRGKAA